jgi:hypothetical protein
MLHVSALCAPLDNCASLVTSCCLLLSSPTAFVVVICFRLPALLLLLLLLLVRVRVYLALSALLVLHSPSASTFAARFSCVDIVLLTVFWWCLLDLVVTRFGLRACCCCCCSCLRLALLYLFVRSPCLRYRFPCFNTAPLSSPLLLLAFVASSRWLALRACCMSAVWAVLAHEITAAAAAAAALLFAFVVGLWMTPWPLVACFLLVCVSPLQAPKYAVGSLAPSVACATLPLSLPSLRSNSIVASCFVCHPSRRFVRAAAAVPLFCMLRSSLLCPLSLFASSCPRPAGLRSSLLCYVLCLRAALRW